MSNAHMKVLSISHTAHSEGSGRLRYIPLVDSNEVSLRVLVPERWKDSRVEKPADQVAGPVDIRPTKIRFPYVKGVKWYAHWYQGLGTLIREFSPDVIHLWEEPWALVALQAAVLRDRFATNAALVLETEQNILRRLPPPFEQIRRYTLKRSDWLIARSHEAVAVSQGCGYKGGSSIVEYCVDRTHFRPAEPSDLNHTTSNARVTLEPLRLGYVGRIIKEKGVFTILEAMRLASSNLSFALLGDGAARAALENKASEYGLRDRIQFLPSAKAVDVARFMTSLDALVLMSETTATWKEQFGRVIIEAQGCGLPVIGSTSGAIPTVISEGGWIIPEGDHEALARLFDRLAADPKAIETARIKALSNVERFTPQAVSASLLSAFRLATENRRVTHL